MRVDDRWVMIEMCRELINGWDGCRYVQREEGMDGMEMGRGREGGILDETVDGTLYYVPEVPRLIVLR